jgi:hypothetical protein
VDRHAANVDSGHSRRRENNDIFLGVPTEMLEQRGFAGTGVAGYEEGG